MVVIRKQRKEGRWAGWFFFDFPEAESLISGGGLFLVRDPAILQPPMNLQPRINGSHSNLRLIPVQVSFHLCLSPHSLTPFLAGWLALQRRSCAERAMKCVIDNKSKLVPGHADIDP